MRRTLSDFIEALEADGQLQRVREPVSPILEIAEVADRQSKRPAPVVSPAGRRTDPLHCEGGGRALLFEQVEGCDFPLAINVFGSYRRAEMALGCAGDDGFASIAAKIEALVQPQPPKSLRDAVAKAKQFLPLLKVGPKRRTSGICQEVVKLASRGEVDLTRLPLIKCWPLDGDPVAVGFDMTAEQAGTAAGAGRYITLAGMHTIHADDADAAKPSSHNIGMYRAQLIDATRLAMHWHMHHDGAAHWRSWKRAGKPMPIAICLGGEAVLPYAATSPLPPGISELLMAGFLNGSGIPMVRARTVPLWVPANSEIVIEGMVSTECGFIDYDPGTGEPLGPGAVFEGPFGDHTGYYSLPDRYPIVEVTAVTHRREAIFPATIVGYPPQEDYYLGKATERIFLPLLRTLIADLRDYHLPLFGCFHNCAFVAIHKEYPLQARRVMHAVWGAGQMAWTKLVVVVDDDVDVHDETAVLAAIFRHCDFEHDLELVNGPLDILDHAAPRLGAGHKLGIDATRWMAGEKGSGVDARHDDPRPVFGHVPEFGGGRCLFVGVDKKAAGEGAAAIEAALRDAPGVDFVVAVDREVDLADHDVVLFHMCANADPGRDIIRDGRRVGIDATRKVPGDERNGEPVRPFPPLIAMCDDVRRRVSERAGVFGLT